MRKLTELNIYRLKESIKEIQYKIDNFDCSEYATDEQYSDFLDELYGDVNICGYEYSASHALQEIDPIAYSCGFSDYCNTLEPSDFKEYQELESELDELESELDELESE
jgi:hypothetical protein